MEQQSFYNIKDVTDKVAELLAEGWNGTNISIHLWTSGSKKAFSVTWELKEA